MADTVETKREKFINGMIAASVKKYGSGSSMRLSSKDVQSLVKMVIPTGAPGLDRILAKDQNGNYGMPVGRIIGISGKEACGKTTLSMSIMKSVQQMGGISRIIETEHAFDPGYAEKLGVNLNDLVISQPEYLEQGLNMVKDDIAMFKTIKEEYKSETGNEWNIPMVIVFDSIAGAPPKAEWESDDIGDFQARGLHARLLSKFFRNISKPIAQEQICLVCTNQTKVDTEVRYGNKNAEIGGMALKFHASLRLDLRRTGFIKPTKTGDAIGIETEAKTVKNKVMLPYKTSRFHILFGEGIKSSHSLFDLLVDKKVIKRKGSTYTLEYKVKNDKTSISAIGREKFIKLLEEKMDKESFMKKMNRLMDKKS